MQNKKKIMNDTIFILYPRTYNRSLSREYKHIII